MTASRSPPNSRWELDVQLLRPSDYVIQAKPPTENSWKSWTKCKLNLFESTGKLTELPGPRSRRRRKPREVSRSLGLLSPQRHLPISEAAAEEVEQGSCQPHKGRQTEVQVAPNWGPLVRPPRFGLGLQKISLQQTKRKERHFQLKKNTQLRKIINKQQIQTKGNTKVDGRRKIVPDGRRKNK